MTKRQLRDAIRASETAESGTQIEFGNEHLLAGAALKDLDRGHWRERRVDLLPLPSELVPFLP